MRLKKELGKSGKAKQTARRFRFIFFDYADGSSNAYQWFYLICVANRNANRPPIHLFQAPFRLKFVLVKKEEHESNDSVLYESREAKHAFQFSSEKTTFRRRIC